MTARSHPCRYDALPAFPGPPALGRGIVVPPGAAAPPGWRGHPRVRVSRQTPSETIDLLHRSWLGRERLVVELAVDPAELRARETLDVEPYELGPDFEFCRERLAFLVWANNYDCLGEVPVWRLAEVAVRRHGAAYGQHADLDLDGEVWCDGGPRGMLELPVIHRESLALGRLTPARRRPPSQDGLAPDQLQAVAHDCGPARVLAPAGSGKTRVMTHRLRHLILDRGYEPELVTAVAYNRRAAAELRERTSDFKPQVSTLHALGYAILRRRGGARLLGEVQVRGVLSKMVKPPQLLSRDPLGPYLEALASVRLGLADPGAVEAGREDVPGFAAVFERYREHLRREGSIDHDEQIYGAIEELLRNPAARDEARRTCRHLLVDEFQDLTPAYLLLVRLLSAPSYQVFGVGDDDQVIYGYAGADPGFLIDFERYFPGSKKYALEINYRCPSPVIEAAARLLRKNQRRVDKAIGYPDTSKASREALRVERCPFGDMTFVAVRWLQAQLETTEPMKIALLTRVNASLLPVQVAMLEAGLPCTAPLDASILERTGIRTALLHLKAASGDLLETPVLLETLRRPTRKIRRKSLESLQARPAWSRNELERVAAGWGSWEQDGLAEYLADLALLRSHLRQGKLVQAFRYLRDQVGLGAEMDQLDSSSGRWGGSHLDDLAALEQLAVLHPDPVSFEDWLRRSLERRGSPQGVRLSSIHRIKGMEWDSVLLFSANRELMPHRLSLDKEEERRIFHVAITRARRQLLILADEKDPSPFLKELKAKARTRSRRR